MDRLASESLWASNNIDSGDSFFFPNDAKTTNNNNSNENNKNNNNNNNNNSLERAAEEASAEMDSTLVCNPSELAMSGDTTTAMSSLLYDDDDDDDDDEAAQVLPADATVYQDDEGGEKSVEVVAQPSQPSIQVLGTPPTRPSSKIASSHVEHRETTPSPSALDSSQTSPVDLSLSQKSAMDLSRPKSFSNATSSTLSALTNADVETTTAAISAQTSADVEAKTLAISAQTNADVEITTAVISAQTNADVETATATKYVGRSVLPTPSKIKEFVPKSAKPKCENASVKDEVDSSARPYESLSRLPPPPSLPQPEESGSIRHLPGMICFSPHECMNILSRGSKCLAFPLLLQPQDEDGDGFDEKFLFHTIDPFINEGQQKVAESRRLVLLKQ